jgi:hypothetical protein
VDLKLHVARAYGVDAGTEPVIDLKKNGSQRSQRDSCGRLACRVAPSRIRYMSAPRPLPVGCLNAGHSKEVPSSSLGEPVLAKRVQYAKLFPNTKFTSIP